MNRELFYEIILFVKEKGFKDHLGMLPVMPLSPTSADALAMRIFWQRRHEIIFSHGFAKAFWGEGYCLCKHCGYKYTDKDFDNEKLWIRKEQGQTIIDYIYCICDRKNDLHVLSIDEESIHNDWSAYLQQMVLEDDPFKYLEKEYKRIKSCRT